VIVASETISGIDGSVEGTIAPWPSRSSRVSTIRSVARADVRPSAGVNAAAGGTRCAGTCGVLATAPSHRSGRKRASVVVPTEIGRDEVRRLLDAGAQLVEVLPREEYEEEHLPGAINLPLKELNRTTAGRLSRAKPVIVYCWDSV
jgi:hypothetical protein